MCGPVGIRILIITAALHGWSLNNRDVKSIFLEKGIGDRDFYAVPPRESADRGRAHCLLLPAAYVLIIAKEKLQSRSDPLLHSLHFQSPPLIPQLFLRFPRGRFNALIPKLVHDFLPTGLESLVHDIITTINQRFLLGTIAHGPGHLRYFGINILQEANLSVTVEADDKPLEISSATISRGRRGDQLSLLATIEIKAFSSLKWINGWLGITSSPFSAEFSFGMQHRAPTPSFADYVAQSVGLRKTSISRHNLLLPAPCSLSQCPVYAPPQ